MADQFMRAGTEVSALIPEVWSAAFVPYLKEKLPLIGWVSKKYQGDIRALGDIVNITSIPQFDIAEDITEDQKVDAVTVTATNTQLTINKQSARDFVLTGLALAQSIDAQAELRDRVMHSIARRMQANIVAAISPSSASPDHQIGFTSGSTLGLADLLSIKELLDTQNVEMEGRKLVCAVAQEVDLFNISGFVSRDFIPAGSPLTSGAIQTPVLGFEVASSTELTNTVYGFHPLFMEMAVQQEPALQQYDLGQQGYRAQRFNMTALYGVRQISNLRVVQIS